MSTTNMFGLSGTNQGTTHLLPSPAVGCVARKDTAPNRTCLANISLKLRRKHACSTYMTLVIAQSWLAESGRAKIEHGAVLCTED
jgi:hypothetical protein